MQESSDFEISDLQPLVNESDRLLCGSDLGTMSAMKPRRFLAPFIVIAVAALAPLAAEQSTTARPPAPTVQIGIVQNPDEYDGFGCRFQLPSDYNKRNYRHIFVSNADEEAIMNIDGSDVRLNRVGFEAGASSNSSRFVDRYRKNELEVSVDLLVTKRCDPSDENCEVTLFDAVITVALGTAKQSVSTKGFCGS